MIPSPPQSSPRYGTDQHHKWSEWRRTGGNYVDPKIPRKLQLSSSSHLSGYSDDRSGELRSICIRNLDNGEQQVVGSHSGNALKSLIVAPQFSIESMLHLTHLSGDEEYNDFSICFHLS